jgi:hypothetical protein
LCGTLWIKMVTNMNIDEHAIIVYAYFVIFDDLKYSCNLCHQYMTWTLL